MPENCLYRGEVVHRRLNPLRHELRYRVFNIFADVDQLGILASRLRLFSYNRFNLLALHDKNHGAGDGTPIRDHAWKLARGAEGGDRITRIFMFCYPSILGYVFNPLTVYYCFDAGSQLRLMIYEVSNTFGGRHSYVIPVKEGLPRSAPKRFYVSPFNAVEGVYGFHGSAPGEHLALGITLSVDDLPILKAYVSGDRVPFGDRELLRSFLGIPFLTLKVIGAIHWQAVKLWCKGLRLRNRHAAPEATAEILPKAQHLP